MTGVRWFSLEPGSGYGDATEAYLHGLRSAGVPVTWTPLGWPSERWAAPFGPVTGGELGGSVHRDIANKSIDHDRIVVSSVPWWHDQLAVEAAGRMLVAYTTWETDRLPADWVSVLNRYDRVLVPSRFNAATFEGSGVTVPTIVVPHIARPAPTLAPEGPRFGPAPFVFYLIATWTTRKAILDAVQAFASAFSADDDVALVIHTTPEDLIAAARPAGGRFPVEHPERTTWFTLAKALAERDRAPQITLSTRQLTRAGVEALHARGDCFLSLSRGEGWGLGAFDAAAFGNPVIVTGWGGTLDFLPGRYPYCVDYDLVPTLTEEPDAWWTPRPHERWAKARIDHAVTLLRQVFEQPDEARAWGHVLQGNVQASFGESQVIPRLLDALA